MEKREKPWNRVFHIVEKENCVYNKSLWIFVKEKNVRIWIGYRKRHIREQRNKEWSRAMVRWSADDIIYEDEQILVCRKHSGMAVQSARVGQMDLESELRNYRNGNYIGIVQRLDQPVEPEPEPEGCHAGSARFPFPHKETERLHHPPANCPYRPQLQQYPR